MEDLDLQKVCRWLGWAVSRGVGGLFPVREALQPSVWQRVSQCSVTPILLDSAWLGQDGTETPLWGWDPLLVPRSAARGPPSGGRDMALHGHGSQRPPLLDSKSAPLRVYFKELRPTPEDNLEIIL
ncbi:hypothetical protein HPG69_015625 [Diceros bicornis minor]|uniref:Uncharacterized protein n=1 Tax=Diceros bicornis minor TaxID=77932 RepID=A0A7J7EEI6_DICBM|nr:hypothetical protein HPG69_015625 [Diceros bicornis minor]